MTFAAELAGLLGAYLPARRWFAGGGRGLASVTVERACTLDPGGGAGDPERPPPPEGTLAHVVARADYADGGQPDRYQVLLGLDRPVGERLGAVVVGGRRVEVRDPLDDQELLLGLVRRMAAGADDGGLRFRNLGDPEALRASSARPLGAEQSNTSLVLDERMVLKLFRKLQQGVNPELEVTRALAEHGFEAIAEPYGWIEGDDGTTMAMVQRYHADAEEGWALALKRSRAWLAGGPARLAEFDLQANDLGEVTARLHLALAEALPVEGGDAEPDAGALRERRMADLDRAVDAVGELAPLREGIATVYAEAASAGPVPPLQRIHGDYHLGQVLLTGAGWIVLDFEGEPGRSLPERRRPDSPLRDIAGMLRSLDYAAFFPLAGGDGDEGGGGSGSAGRAVEWAERAREAFLAGYDKVAGPTRLGGAAALRGFELDKAVYEVLYEARYRPDWLPIPLGGIERLLGAGPSGTPGTGATESGRPRQAR